ncbi:MAG: hypothetical protein R3F19_10900 [Verrucomicrobiales bacterium]
MIAVASSCGRNESAETLVEHADEMTHTVFGGEDIMARAFTKSGIVAPFDCTVYLRGSGGSASATSHMGLGTTNTDFRAILLDLPRISLTGEDDAVEVGRFSMGDPIPLAIVTSWTGRQHYAFVAGGDQASRGAFYDVDGSSGKEGEHGVETIDDHFLLHLDDAASYTFDDNDQDILIEIWFEPNSRPS